MEHLDQAEAHTRKAIGFDLLSDLVGVREQVKIEKYIVHGPKANLEFRMGIRDGQDMRRLMTGVVTGMERALEDMGDVDVDKF